MKQSAFEPKLHREESKLARLEAKLERQTPGSWRHNRTQEKIARQTKIVTPLRRAVRDFQRELKEIHAVSTDEEALARIDHDEELYSTVASMLRTKSREQKQKRKAAAWGSLELRDALTLEGEALEPLSRLGSRQRKRHFGEAIDGVAEGITKLLNPPTLCANMGETLLPH